MKESKWRKETALPETMFQFVRDRISDRKLRLFAVLCCRRIWHLIPPGPGRDAVDVAERFAEGLTSSNELRVARLNGGRNHVLVARNAARDSALTAAKTTSWEARVLAADAAWEAAGRPAAYDFRDSTWDDASHAHCDWIRDMINPFCSPLLDPALTKWHDGMIPKLAQGIYADRAFDRLPILADALEDAGCDNTDVLAHCRSGGEHVRGCWVVDLILVKQ